MTEKPFNYDKFTTSEKPTVYKTIEEARAAKAKNDEALAAARAANAKRSEAQGHTPPEDA